MDRVGPLHRAMAPSHFTFGSHAAMFKGFLPSVRAARPLLNSKLAKLFRLAHAGWPGKEREEFQLQGPSIIEGFHRQGHRTVGSGAVGWFDPATETGRCLTSEFERFFYPGCTWHLAEQLSWIEMQRQDLPPEQPLFLFLNVGETHVPYWHAGAPWDRDDNPCIPFSAPVKSVGAPAVAASVPVWSTLMPCWRLYWRVFRLPPLFSQPITEIAGEKMVFGSMASAIAVLWKCL